MKFMLFFREVEKEKNIENIILYMNLEEVMKIDRLQSM